MIRLVSLFGVLAAMGLAFAPPPARADFSACASALGATDPHEKIELYTSCLKHGGLPRTDVSSAFNNRAVAYQQVGQPDKALQDFDAAIQYDPSWPNAYVGRAAIEAPRGLCKEAVHDLDKALKTGQRNAFFFNQTAWVLATCADSSVRDGSRAVDLAQKALKLKEDSSFHDTLAAAYAEAGRFDEAQAEEARAIQASSGERTERVEGMQARLELYRNRLPFHAAPAPVSASRPSK